MHMQPCRFVREGTLRPLKELLDQFVFEGVLIPDNSCDFSSPFVIVQKKEGEIMAVDYREVNLQLDCTANQLPYQPMLFQTLGKSISPKKITYGDVISCVWSPEGDGRYHAMGCLPFPGLPI